MKANIQLIIVVLLFLFPVIHAQDSEFKDTPYFSGMPNFIIYDAEDNEFDSYNFFNGKNCTTVEGKKFKRIYTLKEDAQKSSIIQISRNYANAVRNIGGTVIFEGAPQNAECADRNGLQMIIGKVVKDGNEMWVEVSPGVDGNDYYLTIVFKELMKQDVTASDMFEALNRDGHLALYVNFDTGKSIIRDESKPIIEQVVQMMKSNPDLKLSIEGHTDNVGGMEFNQGLSERRANAVMEALIKLGVEPRRMRARGFGLTMPKVPNTTEENRAINRRTEFHILAK